MTAIRVITAPAIGGVEDLRAALVDAFEQVKLAVASGESVRFVVHAGDLLGHGSIYDAAYATAVLGMTRAVAFEGKRQGWHVNVIAAPDRNLTDYANFFEDTDAATLQGQVLTLGTGLIGKVIP
jgi:hypothetical protein